MKSSKEKLHLILNTFIFYFIFIFITYSIFINFSFSSDTMSRYMSNLTPSKQFEGYIVGGRLTLYLIANFVNYFISDYIKAQSFFQIMHIILLAISCCLAYLSLIKNTNIDEKKSLVIKIMLLVAAVNPFMIDIFSYSGAGIEFGFSIFIAVLSTYFFLQEKYILSFISLFFAVSGYQSFFSIFVLFICCNLLLKGNFKLDFEIAKKYIYAFIIVLGSCALNVVYPKILILFKLIPQEGKPTTFNHEWGIWKRIGDVFNIKDEIYKNAYGLMQDNVLKIIIGILVVVLVIGIYRMHHKVIYILYTLFILAAMDFSIFAIGLIMSDDAFYYPARITFPIFIFLACIFILAYQCIDIGYLKSLITIVFFVFLLLDIYATQTSGLDLFLTNTLDTKNIRMVESEIEEYQKRTGVEIEIIQTYNAEQWYYYDYMHDQYNYFTINAKECQDELFIRYVTGKNYIVEKMDKQKFISLFSDGKWSCFNASEQLYFEDNTLYWAIY